jgi:hypothetical protein
MRPLVAVNVLLRLDDEARQKALALNAALREDLPWGYTFDETHEPISPCSSGT